MSDRPGNKPITDEHLTGDDQHAPHEDKVESASSLMDSAPNTADDRGEPPIEAILSSAVHASESERPKLTISDDDTQEMIEQRPFFRTDPVSGSEQLPESFMDGLVNKPKESMEVLLSSVVRESRAMRSSLTISDVGTVRQVGDSVASVWGLPQATTDELVRFPNDVMGLVMNLDLDRIDCILLGSDEGIQGGDVVWASGRRMTIPVGDRLLGRTMDPLGRPLDGHGRIYVEERRFIERDAPGIVDRQAVAEPLQTGIKAIDAIIPIGLGQRELIIGDRQTGKTSIAIDTIINQIDRDVVCVYVSIGQRKSATMQVMEILERAGALKHTVIVAAAPDDPPSLLYLAPYSGCTVAEYFLDQGRDVLIVYDDLTKHADAYRELSLLLRRPPGREAYPGDIFYLHSRLLERACRINDSQGGGSITALPIIETRRGNIQAYIPTNLISITDGQVYLSPELFNQGVKPAVDVSLSVSRVGGAAQSPIMRKVSGRLKLMLAQYEEVASFARFGAEIDRATQEQITRGLRLQEILKQPAYQPLSLPQQVLALYAAGEGYLDEVPLDEVLALEAAMWRQAQTEGRRVIRRIEETHDLDDELRSEMQAFIETFVHDWQRD